MADGSALVRFTQTRGLDDINFSSNVSVENKRSFFFFFFLNQSSLFIVSAMSAAGKRSNTISTSLCNAIATYS